MALPAIDDRRIHEGKGGDLFGARVKELRKERRMTAVVLARLTGESSQNISRIENEAKTLPSPDLVRLIARALNTTVEDLVKSAGYRDNDQIEDSVDYRIIAAAKSVPSERQNEFIAAIELFARLARGT